MAMFTDYVFNQETGRHELHFVNQQYDLLMYIRYNNERQAYELSCPHEEAIRIARDWGGRDFDVDYWLKEAAQRLSIADQKHTTQT